MLERRTAPSQAPFCLGDHERPGIGANVRFQPEAGQPSFHGAHAMCHYITAVLPESAEHDRLDAIARHHGRQFQRLCNPGVEAQIPPDEQYFLTTVGHCDWGTALGALARGRGDPDWQALERRLQKKGWSAAKVARAIAQKQEDYRSASATSVDGNRKQLSDWMDFIAAVLSSGKASHLGLLLHMYSGSLESRIVLAGREEVRARDLTVDVLGNLKEDVLYVFRH